jgi:phosphoribosyl-dephospho-CoA transferase
MRRHDLAFLRPGCPLTFQCGVCDSALEARIADWIVAGYPLVIARQGRNADKVLLGLTLPSGEGKRRVGCLVDPADILRIDPPLSIGAVFDALPKDLTPSLGQLARSLGAINVEPGLFGSLSWEILTGETYRNVASDVDVICNVRSTGQIAQTLKALRKAADALPCSLDGEVRFPDGCAVAWKELAAAWGHADAQVLVKSEHDVFLAQVSELVKSCEGECLHA